MPTLRLKTRALLYSMAAAFVPFSLIAIGILTQVRASLLEKARTDHQKIVLRVVHTVETNVAKLKHQLELLALDQRVQSMRRDRLLDAFGSFLRIQDAFDSLYVYDSAKVLRVIKNRDHSNRGFDQIGKDAPGQRYPAVLDRVLQTGKSESWDYLRRDTSQSHLLLLVPILAFTGQGRPVGLISGAIQMYSYEFQELVEDLPLEGTTYCLIIDRKQRILARRGEGIPHHIAKVKLPAVDATSQGPAVWMQVGDRVDLVTVASLPQAGSTIVVGRPADEVLAVLDGLTRRIVVLALVAMVLAIGCALALSRSLARPILLLTEGIRRVGEGATAHRIEIGGDDELAQAGEAFNRMAAQLQKGKLMEQIWARHWDEHK